MVTSKRQWELVCDLPNGAITDDLSDSHDLDFKVVIFFNDK